MVTMTHSEDDMPLDSLIENQLTPEKDKTTSISASTTTTAAAASSFELKKLTISDSQFVIRNAQISLANVDEHVAAFIKSNIAYDTAKYELELFKSLLVNLVPIKQQQHDTVGFSFIL